MAKQRTTATVTRTITAGYAEVALWEGEGPGRERRVAVNDLGAREKDVVSVEPLKAGKSQTSSPTALAYLLCPVLAILGWVLGRDGSIGEHLLGAAMLGIPGFLLGWLCNRKVRMGRAATHRMVEIVKAYQDPLRL